MNPSAAVKATAPLLDEASLKVLREGDTCWRIVRSAHAAVLIDGSDYFTQLDHALRQARRSIFILGWDFDSRIRLCPTMPGSPSLGNFLRELVEDNAQLEVRALIWSAAVVHAPSDPKQLLLGAEWDTHDRIKVKLDTFHPIYGAHHQKVVVIDDSIAFLGGIDLTVRRWDSRPHIVDNPGRVSPEGRPYAPIHDVQMAVDADAAAALGDMARDRWLRATGEELQPDLDRRNLWSHGLAADFTNIKIAIARTYPELGKCKPVTEIEHLTSASLRRAKKHIYIEQQYMTAPFIGEILADHLRKHDGPEIMVLMTRESRGVVERLVMGNNRDRLIRRLKQHDHHGRLRVCYPVIRDGDGGSQVMVHSKLMLIDDWFLRIGSANLNNRSMGLDSECDLAIEAEDEASRAAIVALRWRLIGEHLDADPTILAEHAQACGSMISTIEHFDNKSRGFACFEALSDEGPTRPVWGTSILDPARPFEPLWFLRRKRQRAK